MIYRPTKLVRYQPTDQPTNRPTNQPTDIIIPWVTRTRLKSGPPSSNIAALVSEPDLEVPGLNPGGGKLLHFGGDYYECYYLQISRNRLNDWIYYNTLVFLFIYVLRDKDRDKGRVRGAENETK